MKEQIKHYVRDQQFHPGFLGVFINPFYFVRRALYENIALLSGKINGKVLDIGCGVKPYRTLFAGIQEYVGMEYDSPSNRKKSSAEIFYDGVTFPLPDATFDGAIFTQVLEHVFNPDQFLSEIHRVVKKGGVILITVPFVWDEHAQPYDYARYSSFGLDHLVEKHGFKIVEHRKTLRDIRVIFQLINCYIYKVLPAPKNYYMRIAMYAILISPFTILGTFFSWILPENKDLYMDNVILAEKI